MKSACSLAILDRSCHLAASLSGIANQQGAFKAEDHLTALATLSDQDFAQAFRADGELEHGN